MTGVGPPPATYNESRGSSSLDMRITLHDACGATRHTLVGSLQKKIVTSPQTILSQKSAVLV